MSISPNHKDHQPKRLGWNAAKLNTAVEALNDVYMPSQPEIDEIEVLRWRLMELSRKVGDELATTQGSSE